MRPPTDQRLNVSCDAPYPRGSPRPFTHPARASPSPHRRPAKKRVRSSAAIPPRHFSPPLTLPRARVLPGTRGRPPRAPPSRAATASPPSPGSRRRPRSRPKRSVTLGDKVTGVPLRRRSLRQGLALRRHHDAHRRSRASPTRRPNENSLAVGGHLELPVPRAHRVDRTDHRRGTREPARRDDAVPRLGRQVRQGHLPVHQHRGWRGGADDGYPRHDEAYQFRRGVRRVRVRSSDGWHAARVRGRRQARGAAQHLRDAAPPRGRGARPGERHQQRGQGAAEDPREDQRDGRGGDGEEPRSRCTKTFAATSTSPRRRRSTTASSTRCCTSAAGLGRGEGLAHRRKEKEKTHKSQSRERGFFTSERSRGTVATPRPPPAPVSSGPSRDFFRLLSRWRGSQSQHDEQSQFSTRRGDIFILGRPVSREKPYPND